MIRSILTRLKRRVRTEIGFPNLYNVNRSDEVVVRKRALLVYLCQGFLLPPKSKKLLSHQNLLQSRDIASVLGEAGYVVDVMDITSTQYPEKVYDLVIRQKVGDYVEPESLRRSRKIYLAAGMNHLEQNQNLRERHNRLFERKGVSIPEARMNREETSYLDTCDAMICFGNSFTAATWRKIFKGRIYSFNNYGFENLAISSLRKNFDETRKNFLFLASGSQVLKGLDLLLEIFPRHPDLNLYICSNFKNEPEFCKAYFNELYRQPNVFPVGWINVASLKFAEIVRKCGFAILPSCAEAGAGSVVQAMHAGLVPIVTPQVGIDMEDFGILLPGDGIADIEHVVTAAANNSGEWLEQASIRTLEVARSKYSRNNFLARWREIITDISDGMEAK